jgi:hypothetical protein
MRIALLISISLAALAAAGCPSARKPDADLPLAERAKAALIQLMEDGENPFKGVDPDRMRNVPVVVRAPGRYAWGAFDLDLVRAVYRAEFGTEQLQRRYSGRFKIDMEGGWHAQWPEERQVEETPEPR